MKSLHLVTSDARRGAESFAVDLVNAMRAADEDATILALHTSGSEQALPIPALGTSRRSWQGLRALRQTAKDMDVVVAHGSSTLEACAVALAGSPTPFVYRSIGELGYWADSPSRHRAIRLMLGRAARVVTLWPDAARDLVRAFGVPSDRVDVIPNAVDPARFEVPGNEERAAARLSLGLDPKAPVIAFVGALSPEKNIACVLRALPFLDDVVLLIAGDGPDRSGLEELAAANAPGRVHFLGAVNHPREVLVASDLLILPSLSEGMPAVVIEAAMLGIASLVTPVGALPDMVEDGVNGFLIDSAEPAALATCIITSLGGASAVGQRAAETFRGRYGIEQVAPQWLRSLERAQR